jgi:hypothetical protein
MELPITFPTGETHPLTFYVTPIDESCSVVLGYDWLSRYNPLIDWAKSSIDFWTPEEERQYLSTSPNPQVTVETVSNEPLPRTAPHISFVKAAAFSRAARMPDAEVFILNISDPTISGCSSTISEDPSINLTGVPKEYHDFADVFSQAKASTLPPHRPYNLKINLEEGKDPLPTSRIYLHLQEEVKALQQFIAKNLRTGFTVSVPPPPFTELLFSSSGRRTANSDFVSISVVSIKLLGKTATHSHSQLTCWILPVKPEFTPKLISDTPITWSESLKATNGKPHSGLATDHLNG